MKAGSVMGFHEVVGTPTPYLMKKNLFKIFALQVTGSKNLGHKHLHPTTTIVEHSHLIDTTDMFKKYCTYT